MIHYYELWHIYLWRDYDENNDVSYDSDDTNVMLKKILSTINTKKRGITN